MIKKITPIRDGRRTEYKAEVDGQCIGYFPTHREAQAAIDEHVYTALTHPMCGEPVAA
jgi:hypothetical protein